MALIRRFKKEIGDATYEGMTLPARKGISVGARLLKLLAPSAGGLKGVMNQDGKSQEHLVTALTALVDRIDEDAVVRLVLDMLEGMQRTGKIDEEGGRVKMTPSTPSDFDVIYNSNYEELVQALAYSVEVNLPGFFGKNNIGKVWDRVIRDATHPDLIAEREIWLVVGKGYATLPELETQWSLDDLMRALAVINMQAEIETELHKRAAAEAKKQ
jgi:hypothetical protein